MDAKMEPITPTVGRVMWFYKYVEGQGHKGPLAAIVAAVHSLMNVNLTVFDSGGVPRAETSVFLSQPGCAVPGKADYCEWMPYQVKKSTGSESGEESAGKESI